MIKTSLLLFLLLCSLMSFSQETIPFITTNGKGIFSQVEKDQKSFLNENYSLKIGSGYDVVNGRDYFLYHYRSKNKPFLFYSKNRTASITMNGRKYNDLVLQYDTYTDEVIYSEIENEHYPNLYNISLNKDITGSFTLYFDNDSLTFRNITAQEFPDFNLAYGFYELAYDGETMFIIKHRSAVHEKNGIDEYYYKPSRYVKVGDSYHKIRSSGSFIKLFGDRSGDMKKIISSTNTKINKANKKQIINILRLFDSNSNMSN